MEWLAVVSVLCDMAVLATAYRFFRKAEDDVAETRLQVFDVLMDHRSAIERCWQKRTEAE